MILSSGIYRVTAPLAIPANTTLELGRGAVIQVDNTSGYVSIEASGARLIGHTDDLVDFAAVTSGGDYKPNIKYTGAAGGTPLRIATSHSIQGVHVRGITVDSNNLAANGLIVGGATGSLVWSHFNDFVIVNPAATGNGISVLGSWQDSSLNGLYIYRPDQGGTIAPSSGFGVGLATAAGQGTQTSIRFNGGRVQGFTNAFLIGDTVSGVQATDIHIDKFFIDNLPTNGGAAFNLVSADHVSITRNIVHGNNAASTGSTRALKIGSASRVASNVMFQKNSVGAFDVLIEGFNWQSIFIAENELISATAPSGPAPIAFLNTGGSAVRRYGHFGPNYMVSFAAGKELSGGTQGFDSFFLEGFDPVNFGTRNQPIVQLGKTSDHWTLNNTETAILVPNGYRGVVTVADNLNKSAEIYIPGGAAAPVIKWDSQGTGYSTTQGTASKWNVYWNGTNYVIENQNGSARNFDTQFLIF